MSENEIEIGTLVTKDFGGELGVHTGKVERVPNNVYTVEFKGTEGDIKTVTVKTVPRGRGRPPNTEIGLQKTFDGKIGTIVDEPFM